MNLTAPCLLPEVARLPTSWFARSPREVAVDLLGCSLVRVRDDGAILRGTIVETEAYLGPRDRAAHSFGGRRTSRNESMYARGGTAYVYFTYGMHFCFNVVCGEIDDPVAVLIRALEPTHGIADMRAARLSRRRAAPLQASDLCSGPGKICQALQIDRSLDGIDLSSDPRLFVTPGAQQPGTSHITNAARVGVDYAGEWAKRKLRWYLTQSPHVSRRGC
ncbi:MAG: DNA-3-methyladenine glycosylase [Phycisphaerales bacterium]